MNMKEVFKKYWIAFIGIITLNSIIMKQVIKVVERQNIGEVIQIIFVIVFNFSLMFLLSYIVVYIYNKFFNKK